ncbi:hypothetical protein HMPREF1989_01887 [Porphyromonas gingivalis F0566]|nr:hypothetical protein HMPREF1989_01887 [Porphyromonas gingivalis F0566]
MAAVCSDFNCTIQELKLENSKEQLKAIEDFNCTIQELKQNTQAPTIIMMEFQLHHTGIKTSLSRTEALHLLYFNCTIQELKH